MLERYRRFGFNEESNIVKNISTHSLKVKVFSDDASLDSGKNNFNRMVLSISV